MKYFYHAYFFGLMILVGFGCKKQDPIEEVTCLNPSEIVVSQKSDDSFVLQLVNGDGDSSSIKSISWTVSAKDTLFHLRAGNTLSAKFDLRVSGEVRFIVVIESFCETVTLTSKEIFPENEFKETMVVDWPFTGDTLYSGIITDDGGRVFATSREWVGYKVTKIRSDGSVIWEATYGADGRHHFRKILKTLGGYLVCGYSDSSISPVKTEASRGGYDYWLIKIDENGRKVWDKTIGGNNQDILSDAISTSDGGFLLAGTSISEKSGDKSEGRKDPSLYPNIDSEDYWVVKVSSSGDLLWNRTIGGFKADILSKVIQTADNGFLVAGTSFSPISADRSSTYHGNGDFWVVKLTNSGEVQWDRSFGGSEFDGASDLLQFRDGSYAIAGYSNSQISGNKQSNTFTESDIWIVGMANNGNKLWDKGIGGNKYNKLFGLSVDDSGENAQVLAYAFVGNMPDLLSKPDENEGLVHILINSKGLLVKNNFISNPSSGGARSSGFVCHNKKAIWAFWNSSYREYYFQK